MPDLIPSGIDTPQNRYATEAEALRLFLRLREHGVHFYLSGGGDLRYKGVTSPEDHAALRQHRDAIAGFIRNGVPNPPAPAPEPEPEPEPVLYAYGRRITARDVTDALVSLGDQAVADYATGTMTKARAYEIAQRRVQHQMEWGLR